MALRMTQIMQQEFAVATSHSFIGSLNNDANRDVLAVALSSPLDNAVSALCNTTNLDFLTEARPSWGTEFLQKTREVLGAAFDHGDESALKQVHGALFSLYELHVVDGVSPGAINQFNPLLTQVRNLIERKWLSCETPAYPSEAVGSNGPELVQSLKNLWSQHPVASHPLFDFLERDASREQIVAFFRSDSALNIRFFDLLLFSMIGSREGVRKELVQNLWDESGRGDPIHSHVRLFRHLLDVVGIGQSPDNHAGTLGWQGLAGYNLFMLASLNRTHYFKLLGIMAMTELLDPSQYEKLARGCRRVGLGNANELEYYDEHVTIDVIHGEGWLSNVITPIANETPSVILDILQGASMRLKSCVQYYDSLHARLLCLSPAPEMA
jgi:hypothetical protein